jgi:hypothetical protein
MTEKQNAPQRGTPPSTPGWVKIFFILIILFLIVVVIVHLLGFRFDHGGATLYNNIAGSPHLLHYLMQSI